MASIKRSAPKSVIQQVATICLDLAKSSSQESVDG